MLTEANYNYTSTQQQLESNTESFAISKVLGVKTFTVALTILNTIILKYCCHNKLHNSVMNCIVQHPLIQLYLGSYLSGNKLFLIHLSMPIYIYIYSNHTPTTFLIMPFQYLNTRGTQTFQGGKVPVVLVLQCNYISECTQLWTTIRPTRETSARGQDCYGSSSFSSQGLCWSQFSYQSTHHQVSLILLFTLLGNGKVHPIFCTSECSHTSQQRWQV